MNELEQLKAENTKLKLQIEKTIEKAIKALGIISDDYVSCCPREVNLPEERCSGDCRDCWQKALDTIGGENT